MREHNLALIVDEGVSRLRHPFPGRSIQFRRRTPPSTYICAQRAQQDRSAPTDESRLDRLLCGGCAAAAGSDRGYLSLHERSYSARSAGLVAASAVLQHQIQGKGRSNIATLDTILSRQTLVNRLEIEAGWYAVLRVPELQPQEQTALDLLLKRGVVVHSGGFFWVFRAGMAGCEPSGASK